MLTNISRRCSKAFGLLLAAAFITFLISSSLNAFALPTTYLNKFKTDAKAQREVKRQPLPKKLGQTYVFWVPTGDMSKKVPVKAKLVAVGKHTNVWVDCSQPIPEAAASRLLTHFDDGIYPKNTKYFANPTGLKRANTVNILITDLGSYDGYFASGDSAGPNPLNLIYLNAGLVRNDPVETNNTLAHEFEHLLFYVDGGGNNRWLDEGLAVYAEYINGGKPTSYIDGFISNPRAHPVGQFTDSEGDYGSAFLFVAFSTKHVELSRHSAPKFIQELISHSGSDEKGINEVTRNYISDHRYNSVDKIYNILINRQVSVAYLDRSA